ncbi:ExeA family protein [Candidatus Manganitrophus noduliformans]|uniref:AAA family ATPase n=1 Tax=Candidatus Manganitrophus noduliformans TaxID=2606439 RepID=A0A7X6DSP2_9BACT|nr:AAA family ATPase [Candidatus Manganitrophus noduliformans]NKE72547.1 AAA family ATPase [Candidatus Manganitrophus noduliformans]
MSYLEFYNLKEQPFSISVDNRFYFNSNQHAHALVKLRYAAEERKGLAVLVGGVGTGKTTLARRMLDELEESTFESALLVVIHTSITSEWLLRKIAVQLGVQNPLDDKTELLSQLYNRLVEIYDSGKKAVVLIDEAQMLQRREVMEEFRGILNIELDGQKLITFIFFGLTDLDTYLALDKPLQQRIAVRYELESFTEKTTEEYIRYRLEVAGAKRELFTKGSLTTIHRFSEGIPRLINSICDNALLEGYLRKKDRIDEEMIKEVISDLKLVGTGKDPV